MRRTISSRVLTHQQTGVREGTGVKRKGERTFRVRLFKSPTRPTPAVIAHLMWGVPAALARS